MTIRTEAIRERLLRLREVLSNLRKVRETPREDFLRRFEHHWLAERGLQLAAETLFDVGTHLLAGGFNTHPVDYEDVIRKLGEKKIITPALRERLQGLGGFRNILVHGYLDLDRGRVLDFLQDGLEDFETFAREVEGFLSRPPAF